ncbi:linoleate 9S-lipoxygenase 5-like isoform X2 [Carya illinoinensis]|uniref:linoleate 9S-lipoxygenase 5-like isoform X2 n=1 Tax=Carya illinoinensis TaxID=32201 RepID=UPI001C71C43A|nr:linoleate 9S-lipoxygenase 5-like isoform X2 [Carya illinoinensis]
MEKLCGKNKKKQNHKVDHSKKVKGTVVLLKKNVLDFKDVKASLLDRIHELLGKCVSLQLISSARPNPEDGLRGKLGKVAYLEKWVRTITHFRAGETVFPVTFEWDDSMGAPGALIVKNHHRSQFYLKTVTLEDVPGHGHMVFVCNSWVYPAHRYKYNRVFFSNKTYLPCQTPELLRKYREEELVNLRGNGSEELKEWDRVYDYAYYNDLGSPDKGPDYARPVLGGSKEYPYPRRGRTGRKPTKTEDRSAWRTDEEFAREMLAGVNPVIISRLEKFPPTSELDPKVYGNQNSTIREEHIEKNLKGLTVDRAIKNNRLFILDHHDALMPYLTRINSTTTKTYATRTLLLLRDDGTLKPLAIELSLPHPQGEAHGAVSMVFTPAEEGVEGSLWQLAKAYAAVNDSGYHQLISHWLNTHAVIEPFVIATNRQLSVLHPIYKLLHTHFRDTMHINALARQILINAGGVLERTVFPAKFAMEMSAFVYKNWEFTEQALPADLLKRGIAVPDSSYPHGLRLLIEDYPYAVDGLAIWSAIENWVREYCSFYYPTDDTVQDDSELQSWWMEIRNKGHGDKKDEPWWPEMHTRAELVQVCTIIIWVASALHAAVNFGQYPYAGFLPNRPTVSRRFIPEPGTSEYAELLSNPDLAFLKTITAQFQTLLGVSLIEMLSRHSTDETYLGQRDNPDWTSDAEPIAAFERFRNKLIEIENRVMEMNNDRRWKNRVGPVKVPYTLLYPNTSDYSRMGGLTGKGIPNSISI